MSKVSRLGAACLVIGSLFGFVSVLVRTTISGDAGDLAAALVDHRSAMNAGLAVGAISAVIVIAGIVWWAATLHPHGSALALAGGALGVFGLLAVLFDSAISAAASAAAHADPATATATVEHITGGAMGAAGPISVLGDLGLIILGLITVRIGVPRTAGIAVAVGAIAQAAGFGAGSRPLAAVGFALLFLGFAVVAWTVARREATPERVLTARPA